MKIQLSLQDQENIHNKVRKEHARAEVHTRSWKEDVKNLSRDYLLPKPWQDKVKIRKVLNNLNLRLATFSSDELEVTNIPSNWVLWREMSKNTDKVFKANFLSMNIKSKYREVLIDDALQGAWVLAVDGWNDYKQEPIVSYIDSRLCFPDPKNWQDNSMMFFGTKVRKSWYELQNDEAYDQEELERCRMYIDQDQQQVDRANYAVKDLNEDLWSDEDQTDLYNHITIFKAEYDDKACVYLTTYGNNLWTLVRCVKMRPLNDWEIADPSTIDFGVKIFRAKPIKWSFPWVSLIDDVGQFQDIETLLSNLQIEQAKEAGTGGRTYVNTVLWVDIDDVANNTWPWDIIPFTSSNPAINAQNGIYKEQSRPQNAIVQNTINYLDILSQQADPSGSALAQWQSASWSQTKAEIQTLQQNINHILSYMASNYMDSLKGLWESIYRSYAANMSPQRKKEIVIIEESGNSASYWFKKSEFISKWELYITIKSKAQEDIRQKQDFAVLLSTISLLKASVTPWSTQDVIIDRILIEKSGIHWLDSLMIHPYSQSERKAYRNLEMLNNNVKLRTKPQPWEEHDVFIRIYKTGLDTDARNEAIEMREMILEQEPKQEAQQEMGGTAWVSSQLWASMISSQQAQQVPSTADVSA